MDEINASLHIFLDSIKNKKDMLEIQNNLTQLISQINIYYYNLNLFNIKSCSDTTTSIELLNLEKISEKIRDVYPSFIELRKQRMKEIYVDKLNCNSNPVTLLNNIDKTNKIHSIMSDLTDLLYFNQSSIQDVILNIDSDINTPKKTIKINNYIILFLLLLIVIFITFLCKSKERYINLCKSNFK